MKSEHPPSPLTTVEFGVLRSCPSGPGRPTLFNTNTWLVSRLIVGISRVTIWVIGLINLLSKSP